MRTVEIGEVSLDEYGRRDRNETWILTRRGKPVAALVPVRQGMDAETFSLSHDPAFIEIINKSWAGYKKTAGKSLDEVRKKYGVGKPARKSRRKPR